MGVVLGNPIYCAECGADVDLSRWVEQKGGAHRTGQCQCSEWRVTVWHHPKGWKFLNGARQFSWQLKQAIA